MKLDAPPRYNGARKPGARVWLQQMERYMRLMHYDPMNRLDIVAMRIEGAASSWVNATLQAIQLGWRPYFADWEDFCAAMIAAFEPITETEEARKQLRALKQTGRVAGYIQRFQELQCRLPGMNEEEAFSTFLAGLNPHLQEHVGAHVQGDLEAAKAMALRMDMFHQASGSGDGGKKKEKKKGAVRVIEGPSVGESSEVNVLHGKKKGKEGKKNAGKGKTSKKERGPVKCFNCGGEHPLRACKEWIEIRKKYRSGNP